MDKKGKLYDSSGINIGEFENEAYFIYHTKLATVMDHPAIIPLLEGSNETRYPEFECELALTAT